MKRKIAAAIAALVVVVGLGVSASATPAGTVDYFNTPAQVVLDAQGHDLQTIHAGELTKFGMKIVGTQSTTLTSLVFARRDASGANLDFGRRSGYQIGVNQQVVEATTTFSAVGTYTVWVAYLLNGVWHAPGTKMTINVIPAVTSTPTPTPTPSPSGTFPNASNTGVPDGTTLSPYTGSCTITAANTVIDSKTVTCSTLDIRAPGVVIKNSQLTNTDVNDSNSSSASFTITDSTVTNGSREQCNCIGTHDFTAIRVDVDGGNRSMYCARHCLIQDSWLHHQQLQGAQHGSGLREEQFTTAIHNTLVCDYPITNDATTLGCSADLTGYPDFAPVHDNHIEHNLFLASNTVSFCAYGGGTNGKPFSSDPANATNQVFINNVFQRGPNGKCGHYGPITDFNSSKSGNVWSGNVWDTGGTVPPG